MNIQLASRARTPATVFALLIASAFALNSPPVQAGDQGSPASNATTQNLEFMRARHVPDKVTAVMQKLSRGQQLSPGDEKVLVDWSSQQAGGNRQAFAGGAAPPKPPATGEIAMGSVDSRYDTQSPCVRPGHAAGLGTQPSRPDYLAMAKATLATFGAKLSNDARGKLMQALESAAPTAGSDLAPLLMVTGETDAAVVSAAYASIQAPDDALSANNLGAMLKGAGDYANAAIALQYAAGLAPKSPLIATNLGWLALTQGDSAAAGGFFKTAVAENPKVAGALAGQGLVQMCSGHPAQALPLFRASMAAGYSELAAQGVEIALDSAKQDSHGNAPDTGSPDIYGAKSGAASPNWPAPPIPSDAATMAAYSPADVRRPGAIQSYKLLAEKAELQATAAANAGYEAEDKGPTTRFDGSSIEFDRGYDNEIFVLGDLRTMLQAELDKPMDALDADVDKFIHANGHCLSCASGGYEAPLPASCSYQQEVIAGYPSYAPLFKNDWVELQNALDDLYAFSAPWIARIHDPAIAATERAKLDSFAMTYLSNFAGELLRAAGEVNTRWTFHVENSCSGTPQARPPKPPQLPMYGIDPNDCQVQSTALLMPFASMEANCDQISLQIGVGPFAASGQYKFAPDFTVQNGKYVYTGGNDGAWTIFAGGRIATPGPVSVGVKAGGYVSFEGGHVTDIGLQAGTNFGTGPIPVAGSPSANARLGAMSGLSYAPNAGVAGGWDSQ